VTPIRLGVNVDHVATVRQARRDADPDPVELALICEQAGADSIVAHLREDRRHIQDHDVARLQKRLKTHLNLEMGLSGDIVEVALRIRPRQVTLVPEKRQELTTEGGLDVAGQLEKVRRAVKRFHARGIEVSVFIDPSPGQVAASRRTGATIVEFHTGSYAHAARKGPELRHLVAASRAARRDGLIVAAGHGLTVANVRAVAAIPEVEELNIGFSIVSRALSIGMAKAVREMKETMNAARKG
jgi:pyridoxine 5-phosphate synthase